ncbi:hypothetical protein LOTGIDRAFT_168555 [Lottia gigantea]|uniref:Uncharacterized protein n=1 Tax=Lottia gigantea TaxID=225164 RepID=V3ZK98_LOTGI|nr:hypothetical protein LOTGIDRAFT_168555 [Lottia gigantea]ESO84687.1 hypothetical protein LOTGIDRAFT_168555 [Lottia gigantea]
MCVSISVLANLKFDEGCSPKLIECTANWNTSIQAAKTLDTQCTADKGYEDCLHDSEVFCTSQEKTNVETLLKLIAPKITEHCGGDLKVARDGDSLIVSGNLFHKEAAVKLKDLAPTVRRLNTGIFRRCLVEERRERVGA